MNKKRYWIVSGENSKLVNLEYYSIQDTALDKIIECSDSKFLKLINQINKNISKLCLRIDKLIDAYPDYKFVLNKNELINDLVKIYLEKQKNGVVMEEKERYSLQEFGGDNWEIAIVDNKLCKALSFDRVKNLLNQQDARIKELEKIRDKGNQKLENFYNEKINELDNVYNKHFKELRNENQQLEKQYDELNKNYCKEIDKNINLVEKLKQSQKQLAIKSKDYLLYVRKYSIISNDYEFYIYHCCTNDIFHIIGEMYYRTLERIERINFVEDTQSRRKYWLAENKEILEWDNKYV